MQKYFNYQSKLESFRLFSVAHILTIGIIFVLGFLLFVFQKKIREKQRAFRFSLSVVLFMAELLQHYWLIFEKAWSIKKDLPAHLSDLAVILALLMLVTRSYKLFQFMYFAGLGSSIQAILTPDLGEFSFPHFQYFLFFILHGGVVLACLFMVVAFQYKPTIPSMWVTMLLINLYATIVFQLNSAVGSNYLYIMRKPGNTSVLDYLGSWPWYLLSMDLVMILSFYLLYCPFWVEKKMKG
ncbi:MAG: TIGR02206 family membrane protein [Bacillota bacterium]|nr:TIGR02206 family membrane protein [Bacillota bacterium]